jgi:hypothetical protein
LSFRINEKDEQPLECDPSAVNSHKLPANLVQPNGINVVREEETNLVENLLNSNTTSSNSVWEELDQEGCILISLDQMNTYWLLTISKRIISQVIRHRIGKVEEQSRNSSGMINYFRQT